MKGSDLIELIKDHDLEDFDLKVLIKTNNYNQNSETWGFDYNKQNLDIILDDIGYSDRTATLTINSYE